MSHLRETVTAIRSMLEGGSITLEDADYLELIPRPSDARVWFRVISPTQKGFKGQQVIHWLGDRKPKKAVQFFIRQIEIDQNRWKPTQRQDIPADVLARFDARAVDLGEAQSPGDLMTRYLDHIGYVLKNDESPKEAFAKLRKTNPDAFPVPRAHESFWDAIQDALKRKPEREAVQEESRKFKVGDIVRRTADAMRSMGVVSGPVNGKVVGYSGRFALIQWSDMDDDEEPMPAADAGLELDKRANKKK